jgi:hypothetical protein
MNISKKIFQNKVSREPHQLCMLNEFPWICLQISSTHFRRYAPPQDLQHSQLGMTNIPPELRQAPLREMEYCSTRRSGVQTTGTLWSYKKRRTRFIDAGR